MHINPQDYEYSVVDVSGSENAQASIIGKANDGWEHYDTTLYWDGDRAYIMLFFRRPKKK